MIPIITNSSFEKLGMIEGYISFIWTTRYYKTGDFELCVPIDVKTLSWIKQGYYVIREDDDHVGIIENIRYSKDADDLEMMIVSGRFLSSVLGRRIISQQTQVSGLVPDCMRQLIEENAISPTDPARKIDNLIFESLVETKYKMSTQYTGKNLLEVIEDTCNTYGLGFKTKLNNGKFIFSMYEGVDRSYNQTANPYVVFSSEYDNLESSEYEEDYNEIVTDVLVAGEGEGLDRKTVWASKETNTGLNRYELFKDSRNLSTNDGTISDDVYYNQLRAEGIERLTTYTKAFSGSAYFGNYVYKKDVNIGDVVTVSNSKWGIGINTRLVEVIESTNEAGEYSITPTFGV